MANKTRKYVVRFTWKDEGNRAPAHSHNTTGTTVQRAISKVVKDINEGLVSPEILASIPADLGDEELRASDLMVVDVRSANFT
jgi:hypothetical protein